MDILSITEASGDSMYNRVNTAGIPCMESRSVSTGDTEVIFTFDSQPFIQRRFSGIIAVKLSQAIDSTGDSLPVQFSMAGNAISLMKEGTAVTGSDLKQGIYLVFYDRTANTLQIV